MSILNTIIPPVDENDEAGAPFAESIIIDEGGIDLKIDGETYASASFEGVDPYQIAYEVLPKDFLIPPTWEGGMEGFEEAVQYTSTSDKITDLELESSVRIFLTALARRNGCE